MVRQKRVPVAIGAERVAEARPEPIRIGSLWVIMRPTTVTTYSAVIGTREVQPWMGHKLVRVSVPYASANVSSAESINKGELLIALGAERLSVGLNLSAHVVVMVSRIGELWVDSSAFVGPEKSRFIARVESDIKDELDGNVSDET